MTFLTSLGKVAVGVVCVAVLWEHIVPSWLYANQLSHQIGVAANATARIIEAMSKQLQDLSKVAQQNRMALDYLLAQKKNTAPQHPAGQGGTGGGKRM